MIILSLFMTLVKMTLGFLVHFWCRVLNQMLEGGRCWKESRKYLKAKENAQHQKCLKASLCLAYKMKK